MIKLFAIRFAASFKCVNDSNFTVADRYIVCLENEESNK